MKRNTLILAAIIAVSLQAETFEMTSELMKYTDYKNDLYVKMMSEKRDMIVQERDARELIRDYEALKIYASLRK